MSEKVRKTEEQWRQQLTPEQYRITRERGTERAFTGAYWSSREQGTYRCVCCGQPLFRSQDKFDSGTGWPSFSEPVSEDAVEQRHDASHGMTRTEVVCRHCEAHLGHVFEDGPMPGGLRYCLNSASLKLDPEENTGTSSIMD